MKAKILVVSPKGFSPKRHYRGEGVMERLPLLDPEIEILYPRSDEMWKDLLRCDMVYMFHCIEPQHVEVMKQCLNMGIPVWYDCDDDLFNIPKDNPAARTINPQLQQNHLFMLEQADVITVTTNHLAKIIVERVKKTPMVIANAIDDYVFKDWGNFPEPDRNCMAWRGGASHEADLLNYAEEMWNFLRKTDEKNFLNFMGYYPWWIEKGFLWKPQSFEGRTEYSPYVFNHYEYLLTLKNVVKPWAVFVPLIYHSFNRGKSNIAALEAAYAGAIPISPIWPEWILPHSVHYEEKSLSDCMTEVMKMDPKERNFWRLGNAEYVKAHYSLSLINQRRLKVIEVLLHAK